MKKLLIVLATAIVAAPAWGADQGTFEGKVVVEWMDDPFVPAMRLLEEFGFRQAKGKVWTVPRGQVLDGKAIPPLFRDLIGQPFDGGFRKASVIYDFAAHKTTDSWQDAQRMFFEASVAEGVFPTDAKSMYLVLAAQGTRWKFQGRGASEVVTEFPSPWNGGPWLTRGKVGELLAWVRATDPKLEEIDTRAESAIRAYGPHIFTQPACHQYSGSTRIRKSCDE